MHIAIDAEKCCAAGQCVLVAPEVFDQRDDDGIVVLLDPDPPTSQLDLVRQAVAVCPAAAITVTADAKSRPAEGGNIRSGDGAA